MVRAASRFGVEDNELNRKQCMCNLCPSYPHDSRGEILYCALGSSRCDIRVKGCICNSCPVYFESKLTSVYYCNKAVAGENDVEMRKRLKTEDPSFYQSIVDIKDVAEVGESLVKSMGSLRKARNSLDDLHFVPAQVAMIPLNADERVRTGVVIGRKARRPFKVSSPIMLTGMSFGATSKKVKLIIAEVAKKAKVAFNSGEGGVLDEVIASASKYMIMQYATGRFGVEEGKLKRAAAVEIRFGQGAYPGKGSYLPAGKITPEIAELRGLQPGEPAVSAAHHPDMTSREDIRSKVAWLRELTGGVPVGAKIGCGNIEADVEALVDAGVDFIALDGFGGGTGATTPYVRDNVGIPIIAALPRARRVLEDLGARDRVSLIAGGGLRTSADFAKCLALGADGVYIGTAALIAINCQQYRVCHTGLCPTGVNTNDPRLSALLDFEAGVQRLRNLIRVSTEEIANFARIVGKNAVSKLDMSDLVAMNKELANLTGTKWIDGLTYQVPFPAGI